MRPTEPSGDLPVPLESHALTLITIELQLSDAVADTSMLQCSAKFRILFINAHFVADNASHALAYSSAVSPTFNVAEEVVVIRDGCTSKTKVDTTFRFYEEGKIIICKRYLLGEITLPFMIFLQNFA